MHSKTLDVKELRAIHVCEADAFSKDRVTDINKEDYEYFKESYNIKTTSSCEAELELKH